MARDTVSTVIERIRRQLASTVRMEVNTVGVNLNATATTLTFTYDMTVSVRAGSILSIGSELLRVVGINAAAKTADVIREWQDSTAEAHVVGDEVLINPRFTRFDILDAIIEEIETWAPDLFRLEWYEATTTETTQVVELPLEMQDALGVYSVKRNWTDDQSGSWPEAAFKVQRGPTGGSGWTGADTTGLLVRLTANGGYGRAGSVLVGAAVPYDPSTITEATDLIADLEFESNSLLELVELGVKYRLMADDEHGRSARTSQDEPRRTDEVPAGTSLSVAQSTLQRYERRRHLEVSRLRTKYPMQAW